MDFATYVTTAQHWALEALRRDPVDPIRMLYTTINDPRLSLADRKRVRRCAEAMIRLYRQEPYGPLRHHSRKRC